MEATKTESEKITNMVGTFLNGDCIKAFLKERLAIHTRRTASCGRIVQVVSESVQVSTTKTASEKVTNIVGTFLSDSRNN